MYLASENGSDTEKLSTKQHKALAALMDGQTVLSSAKSAGVAERTLHRWLANDAAFKTAYRRERRAIVDTVVGALQCAMPKAVKTLIRAMDENASPNAVKAAQAVLEHGLKAAHLDLIELREFEEMMPQLRELLDAQRQGNGRASWAG